MSVSEGTSLLDKGFKVEDSGGVSKYRAVVQGSNAGGCALPGAANAANFLGMTLEDQATQYSAVPVRMLGIAYAELGGPVTLGAKLVINGTAGKVKASATTGTTMQNVIGRALEAGVSGDVIQIWVEPDTYYPALS